MATNPTLTLEKGPHCSCKNILAPYCQVIISELACIQCVNEEEEDESFEHTLQVVREVSVYEIPPRTTSGGYKCGEWLQSDKIWTGRIRDVSRRDRCEIRLEDPASDDLFAACFVYPGQREGSVEPVLDSSCYFVLKIEDGQGKHAFIGLGFNERNEAFDFNVALSDHEKYVRREHDKESGNADAAEDSQIHIHPAVNHRLKFKMFLRSKSYLDNTIFNNFELAYVMDVGLLIA
ncbi:uncharacterized protein At1g03900-like [Lotus japonicus]|uniref:uncharacterized protein At1g03900-like n=1 Tax=Lotus japonicus TaxID=34305 RepID=UPI0025862859|nr:uncharacterized protein At1g03900-like [Lotus japonicus]